MNEVSEKGTAEVNIMSDCRQLLWESAHIVDQQEECARLTGENFNLFEILRIGHYEVGTHSALLGDILSPNGSHGQGDVFLKAFLEKMELTGRIDTKTSTIKLEKYLGPKTDAAGGRMDILIQDGKGRSVAIENKIYAADQENQLVRYANWLSEGDVLIYLTLYGEGPDEVTRKKIEKGKKIDLISASYSGDIVEWLDNCHKEAAAIPIVRESIVQYFNLIKRLTNQNSSNLMNQKLAELAEGNIEAFFALRNAERALKERLIRKLNGSLKKATELGGELENLTFEEEIGIRGERYTAVSYTHLTLPTKRIV